MAKSLDQVQTERLAKESQGEEFSGKDTEIAVRMAIKMLSGPDGMTVIEQAINESQDPAMVIGQFLAQMIGILAEKLAVEADVDPRIFLAKRGFLEQILDYIEMKLGYPEEFSDQIYTQVVETIKAAAQQPPAPNNVMGMGQEQPQQEGAV